MVNASIVLLLIHSVLPVFWEQTHSFLVFLAKGACMQMETLAKIVPQSVRYALTSLLAKIVPLVTT